MGNLGAPVTPYQFAKRLEKLADSTEELCDEMAKEALKLVDRGFTTEMDPRGVAWAPRREGGFEGSLLGGRRGYSPGKRRVGHKLLDLTGDLRGSFRVLGVNRNGFAIGSDVSYGGYHQTGTRFMPARRMVPRSSDGLGTWSEPLQEVARKFIRRKLGVT